ncbi:MAG: LUD domain-containing protein [Bacteroidales bacterium]|nr:LUD domain-containing protein [Bacteroidales bacterium]
MDDTTTKEKILKGVRDALISKQEIPFKDVNFSSPVFEKLTDEKAVVFARKLIEMGGAFVYCENEKMLLENLKLLLKQRGWENYYTLDERICSLLNAGEIPYNNNPEDLITLYAGITRCEYMIARFGSVMVSSKLDTGRRMFVFPEVHIIIATASQIVEDLKDAFAGIRNKYQNEFPSQITVITGPSRTADIEKTLVMGAHGPRELFVFMVDDQ